MREILEAPPGNAAFVPGPYTVNYNTPQSNVRDLWGTSLTIDAGFGDYMFTSITAYRESDVDFHMDEDQGPSDSFIVRLTDENDQFSQEFRLASPDTDRYNYVVGFFYLDTASRQEDGYIGHGTAWPTFYPGRTGAPRLSTSTNFAIYGNANFFLADKWTLNLGTRWGYTEKVLIYERENIDGGFFGGGVFPDLGPLRDHYSDPSFSPTLGLQYEVSEKMMTYVRYARGNKTGGWNAGISYKGTPPFEAEKVDNFEIGLKSDFWDSRARVNVAVFYMDYTDLQVTTFGGLSTGIGFEVNSAAAEITGAELDFSLLPVQGLEITGGIGLLDTEFTDYPTSATTSNDGNRIQYAPELNASAAIQYVMPVFATVDLVFRAEYTYKSDFFINPSNDEESRVPSVDLINGRLGLRSQDGKWDVYLWGKNLADEDYLISRQSNTPQVVGGSYGVPRTYGLSVSYNF